MATQDLVFTMSTKVEIRFKPSPPDEPIALDLKRYNLFFDAKIADAPDVLKLDCLDVIGSLSLYRRLLREARKLVAGITNTRPSQWETRRQGYMLIVERRERNGS